MSKILKCETEFTDIDIVRQALELQGFSPIYQEGYPELLMNGYTESFKANLGVSRADYQKVTGIHAFGDMGFEHKATGPLGFTFDDLNMNGPQFTKVFDGIKAAYAEKKYDLDMYQSGYTQSSRVVNAEGVVELEYARMASV